MEAKFLSITQNDDNVLPLRVNHRRPDLPTSRRQSVEHGALVDGRRFDEKFSGVGEKKLSAKILAATSVLVENVSGKLIELFAIVTVDR